MLYRLEKLKKLFTGGFIAMAICLAVVALVGGLCFKLDPVTIASWFVLVIAAGLVLSFVIALIMFLYWFIVEHPSFVVFALIAVVIIVVAVIAFISTNISFLAPLGDVFKGLFAWLA